LTSITTFPRFHTCTPKKKHFKSPSHALEKTQATVVCPLGLIF
jgi:hypothetical protein